MLLSQCSKLLTSLVSHGWVRVQYGGRRSWTDHLTPRAGNTIYNVSDTAKLVITNNHEKKKKKKKNVGFSVFIVSAGSYCTVYTVQLVAHFLAWHCPFWLFLWFHAIVAAAGLGWRRVRAVRELDQTPPSPPGNISPAWLLIVSWSSANHQLIVSWSSVDCQLTSVDRQLVVSWSSAGRQLVVSWPSADRPLCVSWSVADRQQIFFMINKLVGSPEVCWLNLLEYSWWSTLSLTRWRS